MKNNSKRPNGSNNSLVNPSTDTIIGPVVTPLPAVDGDILGGFQVNGFVEAERALSFRNSAGMNRTIFLEKKLPFQTTVIVVPGSPTPLNIAISLSGAEEDCQPFTLNGTFLVNGVGVPGVPITFTVTGPARVAPTSVITGAGGTFSTRVTPLVPGQAVTITATSTAVNGLPSVSQRFTFTCTL